MARIQPPGFPVERGKIHEFANSVLSDDPLHHDLEAARGAGLPSVVAPPTFPSAAAFFPDEGVRGPDLKGLDMRFLLHGGQEPSTSGPSSRGTSSTRSPARPGAGRRRESVAAR
ncbi:MAG: MaoC family dehydratase N-terminal domain-containing protein [Acidimicrobiia bacterium]|nr:MaoC family dehydratase N-terminal domain-containing protein [Acidimicrobiia bacterium]